MLIPNNSKLKIYKLQTNAWESVLGNHWGLVLHPSYGIYWLPAEFPHL